MTKPTRNYWIPIKARFPFFFVEFPLSFFNMRCSLMQLQERTSAFKNEYGKDNDRRAENTYPTQAETSNSIHRDSPRICRQSKPRVPFPQSWQSKMTVFSEAIFWGIFWRIPANRFPKYQLLP